MSDETCYLTTVKDAVYPDGQVGPVYALVGIRANTGIAVEVKGAIALQVGQRLEYRVTDFTPEDFDTWFGPDFPPLGETLKPILEEAT